MSDIEYSVITSDIIKSFDCIFEQAIYHFSNWIRAVQCNFLTDILDLVYFIYLSLFTGTIACDHYARECEFGILKNKTKQKTKTKQKKNKKNLSTVFWLNEVCPKLLSSLGIDHRRRKTIPLWNSSGNKWIIQSITVCLVSTILGTVWCLVDFKLWAGVRNLSFSIDTAPESILWKRSREDRSLWASRDGHSSSSSISLTLLVFRHLLQVQRAAVLWTFSTWLIWSFDGCMHTLV